ncbi:NAD(P)-dependent glycerol-3-phosphate dehydrogenase [Oscillospiraceae bacterium CM]|nr:NAD(P)-dependent glycerol-3-phosphate dehydrogenase [Oscillospiraceae bacterium CM]
MKISVFGSGGWGTAIAKVLHENGHAVTLWSKFEKEVETLTKTRENPLLRGVKIPEGIAITTSLDDAADGLDVAVMATPSFAVAETALLLKDRLKPDCIVVCVSKGIEKDTTRLFSTILREALGDGARLVSLSGPTHAEEVGRQIPTACVAASEDIATAEAVQDIFMNDYFRVYTSTDVIGVELGAALKNVIALGAGISDGLGFGDNTIAMLMTRGLAEMAELCVALGGRKSTLAGLAGLGDLIVTCTSKHSRNRRAGVLIGKGMDIQEAMQEVGAVVEGYYAAKAAYELSQKTGIDMPISTEAYRVLYEGKSAMTAMKDLMSRSKRREWESAEETWVV